LPHFLISIPIVGLFLICTSDGMQQSPDSKFYLYIAEHLVETGQFRAPGGKAITYWPPIYILALTPVALFTAYPFYLHLCLLVLHQLLLLKLAKKYLDGTELLLFSALSGCSTLTLMVSVYVWSELLFMIFLLLAVLNIEKWKEGFDWKDLILFTLTLSAAVLTRNAGIFMCIPLGLYALIHFKNPFRWQLAVAVSFAVLSNFIWNWGRRIFSEKSHVFTELMPTWSPLKNLYLTFGEMGYNFLPRFIPDWLVAIMTFMGLVILLRRYFKKNIMLTLAMGYLVFWIIIPADAADIGRFIAPVWSFVLLSLVMLLQEYRSILPKAVFWLSATYILVFSIIRITINAMTWA